MTDYTQILLAISSALIGVIVTYIKSKFWKIKDLLSFRFGDSNVFKDENTTLYFNQVIIKNHGKNVLNNVSVLVDNEEVKKSEASISIIYDDEIIETVSDGKFRYVISKLFPEEEISVGIMSCSKISNMILKKVHSDECVAKPFNDVKTANDYINTGVLYLCAAFAGIGVLFTSYYVTSFATEYLNRSNGSQHYQSNNEIGRDFRQSGTKDIVVETNYKEYIVSSGDTLDLVITISSSNKKPIFDVLSEIKIPGISLPYNERYNDINVIRVGEKFNVTKKIFIPKELAGLECKGIVKVGYAVDAKLFDSSNEFKISIK